MATPSDRERAPQSGPCPDEEGLVAFVEGTVSDEARHAVQEHVATCASCRELLAAVARAQAPPPDGEQPSWLETAWSHPEAGAARAGPPALLAAGATVGRYVVLELIGAGAMGCVYAAYDPELHRKIALKLVRAFTGSTKERAQLRERLLREAKTMARLSHPCVVPIHDAALLADEIFVAMEFVEGTNLREWLRERPRPWREVLAVFRQAAEGLAAAHAAGIVHRDFKPENVLFGADGRVRITDFGLARSGDAPAPPELSAPATEATRASVSLSPSVTRTGSLIGTPAYMAPEQVVGGPVGAAADQFAFCVALYEGVYGERPFPGDDLGALYESAVQGHIRPAPRGSRVPAWLRRALVRGLAPEPGARHASMEALLAELGKDRRTLQRRVLAGAAAVVLLAGGVSIHRFVLGDEPALCTSAEAEIAAIWNPDRASTVRAAFLATRKPFAGTVFDTVDAALTAYARGWAGAQTEACRATRVLGHQSEELMDLRVQCLRDHRRQMGALVDLFSRAEGGVVDRAVDAVSGLPGLGVCAAEVVLRTRVLPPASEAVRQRADELRAQRARARALARAGLTEEALGATTPIVAAARALGYPPLEAEALVLLASLQRQRRQLSASKESYEEALHAAAVGRHEGAAAEAFLGLAWVVGVLEARREQGQHLLRHASAIIPRLGDPWLESQAAYYGGRFALEASDLSGARAKYEEALRIRTAALGEDHHFNAYVLVALGVVARRDGRIADARRLYERALALQERAQGREHPALAPFLHNVANVLWYDVGDYEAALPLHERALELHTRLRGPRSAEVAGAFVTIGLLRADLGEHPCGIALVEKGVRLLEETQGPKHPEVATAHYNLGSVLADVGRNAEALAVFRRARAHWESPGAENPLRLAEALAGEARVLQELSRPAEALAAIRRALSLREKVSRPDHPWLADDRLLLCRILGAQGDAAHALEPCRQGLAVYEKLYGPTNRRLALPLVNLGEIQLRLGKLSLAKASLLRALGLLEPRKGDLPLKARGRFAAARALGALGEDRDRARELARRAQEAYRRMGMADPRAAREIDAWLAAHGPSARAASSR